MRERYFQFVDSLPMYTLLVYGLVALSGIGLLYSALGVISLPSGGLILLLACVTSTALFAQKFFARVTGITANDTSWLITALILFLVMTPVTSVRHFAAAIVAVLVAIASKFILTFRGAHIFNPAALGVAFVSLAGLSGAAWWVGSSALLLFTMILVAIVATKLRLGMLVAASVLLGMGVTILLAITRDLNVVESVRMVIVSSPLIFLAGIMLTEPATMPPRSYQRCIFAAIVIILFCSQLHVLGEYITPALALLAGNIYACIVSRRTNARLLLKEIRQLTPLTYDFIFTPSRKLHFTAGQYMQWTLGSVAYDGRGNRRTFSIASSPSEADVHLGIKIPEKPSNFKKKLLTMQPGDSLIAGQVAGDFVLPKNSRQKLVMIAGGIGITPIRSMLEHVLALEENRDITLYYLAENEEALSYRDDISRYQNAGVRVHFILGGPLTQTHIQQDMPDFARRHFYISGPSSMVRIYQGMLRSVDVPSGQITTDMFSGY